ncbi:MAG: mandelate racemase/muconate lactonizing enzyme family protein [Chloroflexi bacterium]|nr:mandelate racemase/muconate lactonizing enzyme family protein [Chloroflexota bacterium]
MSRITRIEISHHQLPLDPPFPASWDPVPRELFPCTIVRVHDDEGRVGIGSGDAMHGFADFVRYFVGQDPLDVERHHTVLSNIGFHACRPWPLDVALWDLAGKTRGEPVWRMLGGATDRIRAYASTGVRRTPAQMIDVARAAVERGFAALKLRIGGDTLEENLAAVSAVRDAVGDSLELMVDCNQGWRMPWDTSPPWELATAVKVARRLESERIFWMEEPLDRGDYDGHAALRQETSIPIAGGEVTREPYEFRELLQRECLDVFQPDCVFTMGISGLRHLAREVAAAGKTFTPHTWGNGIGLMANLQLTAGTSGAPFIEFPFDPPEWTTERRDFMLTRTIEPDDEGWLKLPDAPGLGIELDEDALQRTRSESATYSG